MPENTQIEQVSHTTGGPHAIPEMDSIEQQGVASADACTCGRCGAARGTPIAVRGEQWCPECVGDYSFVCEACGCRLPVSARSLDIHGCCCECAENHFVCSQCVEVRPVRCMERVYGDVYCRSCYEESFAQCDNCGSTCPTGDIDDEGLCRDCGRPRRQTHQPPGRIDPSAPLGYLAPVYLGFELEVIGSADDSPWAAVSDGSLSDGGREYVSRPVYGQQAIDSVRSMCAALRDGDCHVNVTCGYHLHIDASQADESRVARFVQIAKRLENWAFATQPKSRQTSNYCDKLPSLAMSANRDNLEEIAYFHGDPARKDQKYNAARYSWVNLHSWYFRGTIEIRCHAGTIVCAKVLNWAEVWSKVWHATESAALSDRITNLIAATADWANLALADCGVRESTIEYYRGRSQTLAR